MSFEPATRRHQPQSTVLNFNQDDDELIGRDGVNDALLRESGHLARSEQLIDEQFEIAIKTRENLANQGWAIRSMREQYENITDRFGTIGSLVKKIRIRKRRDTIIVAIVFAICLALLLYNIF